MAGPYWIVAPPPSSGWNYHFGSGRSCSVFVSSLVVVREMMYLSVMLPGCQMQVELQTKGYRSPPGLGAHPGLEQNSPESCMMNSKTLQPYVAGGQKNSLSFELEVGDLLP